MGGILKVRNLKVMFNKGRKSEVWAVDGVSFEIKRGETLGLVGESGCGKSTTGRAIVGLIKPTDGEIFFEGENIRNIKRAEFSRNVQMIFQDPFSSLNPRMTVADIIAEGIDIHELAKNKDDREQKVTKLLEAVGLNPEHATRYPHEFSGGQRQRIGIARALAVEPKLIICDEPISALDVSIQAQIINLLLRLQKELGLTLLFIAHDLAMVKYISDKICVMYDGKVVEQALSDELYSNPLHPYTKSLISAISVPDPDLESVREVTAYDTRLHNYNANSDVEFHEVFNGHHVLCSKKELQAYKNG